MLSADCTDVSGTTETIEVSCTHLLIDGDGSNVTINSDVTIDYTGKGAVNTSGGTNTTLTNNGTIETTWHYGLRHTGSGTMTTLTNTGSITTATRYGLSTAVDSSITTITNSGTISAGSHSGLRNYRGTIGTITNSGTISAVGKWGLYNNGTIDTITNSGTISAGNTDNDSDYGLFNSGTIETITNSYTISATNRYGLYNSGTITTLTNTINGEISAGTNYAIANTGSIVTLTNTGSITATTGAVDISNQGTITTFNNLQGKKDSNSNPVTFIKSLPTNYNVIVNDTDNYGQIEFSSFSGTTTFGVDKDRSTFVDVDTTYSSVLKGLSRSDIASGFSGPLGVSGSLRKNWTLENSPGELEEWDLNLTVIDITPDTNTSVTSSVKPNVILGINNLTSVTEVNFANMNTYDCDLFGKNNICLSLGGRHTAINTPKTRTNSAVLVGGYRLSDTLRVAGFYHRNLSHKTPASYKLSDKTPMTGGLIVWNQNPNKLGYQLKLANAYQQKNATLTREVVSSSEEGKGQTVIEAESYVAELQYGYQFSDDTVLHPYLAARSAVIKQDAYTETGLSSPLSFNEIKDKSTTVLLGLKFNTRLSHNLSLKGSLGVEHDIEHSVDKLAPTGISGLSTVSLTDSFNKTRPVVSLGFDYALKPNHRLSGILQYQELPYESKTESNVYLYYTIGF